MQWTSGRFVAGCDRALGYDGRAGQAGLVSEAPMVDRTSRSRGSAAGGAVAALAIGVLAWALAPGLLRGEESPAVGPPAESSSVTQVNADGLHLYLQSCASCHGAGGEGGPNGPDIRNAGQALVDFVLRTGRMPLAATDAQPQRKDPAFDEPEIDALVAYVSGLGQGPAIPNVVIEGADVAHGRDLYVANCAACHGPAGGGGAVGGGFVAPGLTQADPTEIGEAVLGGPNPMPRFAFPEQDLNALAAYVTYLKTAAHPGGLTSPVMGPVTEGFVAAIGLIALLLVARWIGVRRDTSSPGDRAAAGPRANR
jgi:ubiquinol-cytochrome c reductase cytochrome c subunit